MAKAPSASDLADEKYIKFIQDVVDVYGIIHCRYLRSPEGKFFEYRNLSSIFIIF